MGIKRSGGAAEQWVGTASAEVENLQIKRRINSAVQIKGNGWNRAPNRPGVEQSKKRRRGALRGIPTSEKVRHGVEPFENVREGKVAV
jgi:hypothetical protein